MSPGKEMKAKASPKDFVRIIIYFLSCSFEFVDWGDWIITKYIKEQTIMFWYWDKQYQQPIGCPNSEWSNLNKEKNQR